MGFLDRVFKRNSELGFMFDLDLFEKDVTRAHMKKLAIEICVSFLARTISQSEFRVRNKEEYLKDELYYRLNVRPNKNMTASTFWQEFVYKMFHSNEVLIIQANDGDLLIADGFEQKKYAVYDDTFSKVVVRDFEFLGTFRQQEVIHLKYGNERLSKLIDGLFTDYEELYGRMMAAQKRKSQIRGTVDMDMLSAKSKEHQVKLQEFIDNMYKAIREKDVAIIPQQPGFKYDETSGGNSAAGSVEEINKLTDGFLDQVAMAAGVPVSLIKGDMADVEKQTKNYMFFTVSPLLKKIKDESDVKFFTKKDWLDGKCIEIRKPSYRDIFDLATAADKLRSSGIMNGHEIRDELGLERVEDPMLDKYVITKNYQTSEQALEGGEDE